MPNKSIFEEYYSEQTFYDRKVENNEEGVDVIIPLINTNELWETNLHCYYREVPINRLLIGDGGCTDETIEVVKKFPRVEVIDQSNYYSQGYCIKELMEKVTAEWFIYFHADVYLPKGWYDEMVKHQNNLDWFECNRHFTTLLEHVEHRQNAAERSYSGSQMGRTKAFEKVLPVIDDDFLQRNEDIIFAELVTANGGKYGRVKETFHYHQAMNKRGETEPNLKSVTFEKESDTEWEKRIFNMQARGIIKYLEPKPYLVKNVNNALNILYELGALDWKEFTQWTNETNKSWNKYIRKKENKILMAMRAAVNAFKK